MIPQLAVFTGTIAFVAVAALSLAQPSETKHAAANELDAAAALERGEYLVTAMGCNDCHTPWHMTPNGPEPDMSKMLSGHPSGFVVTTPPKLDAPWIAAVAATNTAVSGPWGISYSANLTPDLDTGIGRWTEEEFVATLRSGRHMGRGRELLPPMPWKFFGQLDDQDLHAIFTYLRTIPAIANKVPNPIAPAPQPEPKATNVAR